MMGVRRHGGEKGERDGEKVKTEDEEDGEGGEVAKVEEVPFASQRVPRKACSLSP